MKAVPWFLVAAGLVGWAVAREMKGSAAVDRALAAEAAVATLRPLADSLRAEAERRDTLLVHVTDTIRVVVTRERVVQVAVVDTLRATLDSAQTALLDTLVASHATEVAALERLAQERLLWGQGWKDAAEAAQAGWDAERARADAWEAAARSGDRQKWKERVAFVLTAGCIAFC